MATKTFQTPVCIIGAGPSGATTSLFLSKLKVPHIIIDAAIFPRDKICGDVLDLKVVRVLNHLDETLVEREIMNNENFVKAWGASIIISKNKKYGVQMKSADEKPGQYPFFFVSKRAYFDNFLVRKMDSAFATFMQGTKAKNIARENDKWIITANKLATIEIHANLVVGADGDHSAVLRSLGERKINRKHYAASLRQYWKGVSGMTAQNHLEVYLPKTLPLAYLWIFPLPNGEANVGCGLASDIISAKSVDLKKLFDKLIKEDPALADRFKDAQPLENPVGWGLPLASQKRKASGDGYLLTGDAASLVSPVTGEGIGPGMFSGYIAAHFIARAVKEKRYDKSMFANYDREINKRLLSDIKKYNFLRKVSPLLYNKLINVLSRSRLSQYYFDRNIAKWIKTATDKPIDIAF